MKKVVVIGVVVGFLFGGDSLLYKQLCGECHMAYQPQLLPKRSWIKIMDTLEDHFGVDATLEKNESERIRAYLIKNAGDSVIKDRELAKFAWSVPRDETPLEITKTPYFKKEHREIPKWMVKQKEVKTFSNCTACHRGAQRGIYEDDYIIIPNYGEWED